MNTAKQRIEALRDALRQAGIDFYIVPTADFHNSEYVDGYFKVREFLSGFTGSNGTLVVSEREAGLWTDGRYFVQAQRELEGSDIVLYRMGEENVPTITEYLEKNVSDGQTIGFDGRVVSASFGKKLEKAFDGRQVRIVWEQDIVDALWTDRPAIPASALWVLPETLCGETIAQKLEKVREKMKAEKAAHLLISKLDDIMWLYNVRANDVACNPVALSYTFLSMDSAVLFVQREALTEETREYFRKNNVECRDYETLAGFLEDCALEGKIWCAEGDVSYLLYKLATKRGELIGKENPVGILKAVKNPVELENIRKYYLLDSVALTKFLFWMKRSVGKVPMDEYSAAQKLDGMRAEIEGFVELSFDTISAYGANAAMMHYEATAQDKAEIKPEGFYLVDSGGQYMGATTDVTRTIVLGPITDEMKKHFTKTVCGMLRLADAKFLYGCTGRNVDILARLPLWECAIDYKCGTGHGIGYILNVHEGPQSIRWKYVADVGETVLEQGMIVSDEPGVYIEGSHGIRIENVVEVVNEVKNGDGQFMGFRHLTCVPIDLDAIDTGYMEASDVRRLNAYHEMVYEKLAPYFEGEELEQLRAATRAV
ncbi:MAG: aminopeptidase P family protein [Roseburia sp.]|nr:aminopeptidase P family protein [Roseburia sp.]